MPILQNPHHHLRHHPPKLMACMSRLLLDKATSLVVAGEALYLDFVDFEDASSPTPSVAEESSVGGDEDFYGSPGCYQVFIGSNVSEGSSVGPLELPCSLGVSDLQYFLTRAR